MRTQSKLFHAEEKYFNIRDLAWTLLIECDISELPVDLNKIAALKGWIIMSETMYDETIENEIELRRITVKGKPINIIVYKETANRYRLRFGIAHEMGHIILEHLGLTGTQLETEANMFAARLLVPRVAIEGLQLKTEEEIMKACDVSAEVARFRLKSHADIMARGKFLSSKLEQKLYEQLESFFRSKIKSVFPIDENNKKD